MTTTKWEIVSVKAFKELNDKANVVSQVQWMITASGNNKSSLVFGNQDLHIATDTFIPFDQLTEATLIEWVKTAMGASQVEYFENKAIADLTQNKTDVQAVSVELPWVK
jgi:hypothetical protein